MNRVSGTEPSEFFKERKVFTADGPMYEVGSFWSFGASFIDICMMLLLIFLVLSLVDQQSFEIISEWAGWVPGVLAIIYGILTYMRKVPSFGNWALALKKYPRSDVEGYAGKGTLLLIKDLTLMARIGRLATAIFVLILLFIAFIIMSWNNHPVW